MQTIDKLAASAENLSEVFDAIAGSAAGQWAKKGSRGMMAAAADEARDFWDMKLPNKTPYDPARGAKNPARAGQPDAKTPARAGQPDAGAGGKK